MRTRLSVLLLITCLIAGCNQRDATSSAGPKSLGRYSGIGTFDAGRLWREMKAAPVSKDTAAAQLADDEHVIVVLDSHTGEVRQCGDHSGFCVAMNPWANGTAEAAPVKLTKHAAEVEADDESSVSAKTPAQDQATNKAPTAH